MHMYNFSFSLTSTIASKKILFQDMENIQSDVCNKLTCRKLKYLRFLYYYFRCMLFNTLRKTYRKRTRLPFFISSLFTIKQKHFIAMQWWLNNQKISCCGELWLTYKVKSCRPRLDWNITVYQHWFKGNGEAMMIRYCSPGLFTTCVWRLKSFLFQWCFLLPSYSIWFPNANTLWVKSTVKMGNYLLIMPMNMCITLLITCSNRFFLDKQNL